MSLVAISYKNSAVRDYVDSINFRSRVQITKSAQDFEAGFKNTVIDYYNYTFIPDPKPDVEGSSVSDKKVGIVCQEHLLMPKERKILTYYI